MANFNKVILVGRLTRDPEVRTTNSGMKVAGISFAVTNKKKDQGGQWVDDPMFIDVTAFDRANEGRGLASTVEQYCFKGSQIMIEGKLQLETWEDKNGGGKRSKHKIIADVIQLLDPPGTPRGGSRDESGDELDAPAPRQSPPPARSGPPAGAVSRPPANRPNPPQQQRQPARPASNDEYDNQGGGGQDDIPF